MANDPLRRNDVQRHTPTERAIFDAIKMVEEMPADERLTAASILLSEAQSKVADFIDAQPEE